MLLFLRVVYVVARSMLSMHSWRGMVSSVRVVSGCDMLEALHSFVSTDAE